MNSVTDNRFINLQRSAFWLACLSVLALSVVAYWPGLKGPFVFDDFGSLAKLGNLGGIRDWDTLRAFVLGGTAGPTGRPLALLSFLIDGNNWPTDPWPFKRTNLVIHIINGAILCVLSTRLLKLFVPEQKDLRWLGLAAAALWLLHPFLVSTTLYAVQRMAQLSTGFVLLGMLSHILLRGRLEKRPSSTHLLMGASLTVFTGLAALSKENGVILPLLIAILEATLPRGTDNGAAAPGRAWMAVFLWLPSAALLTYLGTHTLGGAWLETNFTRGVSVYERVLTEFRVLIDYQRHWFFPSPATSGVFQDHVQPSRGILTPQTTAFAAIFHACVIAACLTLRRRSPLVAFAGLFFYGAHLLESTVINLELYFEHRNYLACTFLLLPVVVFLHSKVSRPLFAITLIATIGVLVGFTRHSAGTWSSYETMVESAAAIAPDSPRAQQQYSQQLFNSGAHAEAIAIADRALENMPEDDSLLLHRSILDCQLGSASQARYANMANVLSKKPYDLRILQFYQSLVSLVLQGQCAPIGTEDLRSMFIRMLEVPVNSDRSYAAFNQINYFIGLTEIHLGHPKNAMDRFNDALASRPDPRIAMSMAAVLASQGFFTEAIVIADTAEQLAVESTQADSADYRILRRDIVEFKRTANEELRNLQNTQN